MAKPYAHPEVLVTTAWVEEHRADPKVRIVESDEDVLLYQQGHVPGAVKIDWHTDLQDQIVRDYIDKDRFAALCSSKGIANDTTVVFYGDKNNWWACYAFWVFKLYGHAECRIMNGGRKRWELDGRPWSRDPEPQYPRTNYVAKRCRSLDPRLPRRSASSTSGRQAAGRRALARRVHRRAAAHARLSAGGRPARRPHSRRVQHSLVARRQRRRHVQVGARSLEKIYADEAGLKRRSPVIAYCRIGERSSHTWFVLHYLLGFPKVKNYDGSWTEWGNTVGVPIEKGPGQRGATRGAGKERFVSETLAERVESIAGEFAELEPRERLELLLGIRREIAPLARALPGPARRGTEPRAGVPDAGLFVGRKSTTDGVHIYADVAPEAPTVKGFVSLLAEIFSGATPEEVLSCEPNLVNRFGLAESLGMVRMRGLQSIAHYIRQKVARAATE